MCTYLSKRGATYYFRRIIPAELRPAFNGASEFTFSLRTKDREEAKRLIPERTLETDRRLDRARAMLAPVAPEKPGERVSNTAAWAEAARDELDSEAAEIAYWEGEAAEERHAAREPHRQQLERAFRKSTAEITPQEAAARDLVRDLTHRLTVAEGQLLSQTVRRALDRRGIEPLETAPAVQTGSTKGVMLDTDIVDGWAAERKPVQKGIDTHRGVARWFYERVGSKPVNQITRRDVLAFKDKLVEEGQSAANIIMKLSRLRTLLQWAADNEHLSENPAAAVRVIDTDRARNRRQPFDLASLNRIFSSPVFADGARPAPGRGEAAYWLPILALYTGARLEELAQLRPSDVQEVAYPDANGREVRSWFIRIREDVKDNLQLKNAASERDVPVHPELERLGFLAFVSSAKVAKQDRLFSRLNANIYGRLSAKWGEWFSAYLRGTCGVTDRRMVFHSFRHTFKDYARHAGIIEGVQRQIMGHSSSDVADQYGSGYPVHQVVAGMSAYSVPGLTLITESLFSAADGEPSQPASR